MRRLKVTYLTVQQHASNGMLKNIGDRIIELGVRNIMRCALGEHDEAFCYLETEDPLPADTDIAVVCGMPQILNSRPSQLITRIGQVAQADVPLKINLGAGAFYFDAFGDDREKRDQAFAERLFAHPGTEVYAQYAGFDLCTCRDKAGEIVLRKFGVRPLALPCPGFFSAMFEPRPLLRRPNQLVSPLNGTASFWNTVRGDVHGFYRRLHDADPGRIFIAHDEQDCTMLSDLGIPYVVFNDASSFLTFLASSDSILSARVHGALPSWTLGLDVTLLGIDRRALLGEDFGAQMRVIPIRTDEDLRRAEEVPVTRGPSQGDDARREWLMRYLGEYVRSIRAAVSAKLGVEIDGADADPLGGRHRREVDRLRGATRPGQYFSKLFHSTDSGFPVPPELVRSRHATERAADRVTLTADGKLSTLTFGPYIRIPKARWRASGTVSMATDGPRPNKLEMAVLKGIPGVTLGRQVKELGAPADPSRTMLDVEFDNPSDTGELEIVLKSAPACAEGTRLVITDLRLERVD